MFNKTIRRVILLTILVLTILLFSATASYANSDRDKFLFDAATLSNNNIAVLFSKGGTSSGNIISGGKLYLGVYNPATEAWREVPVGIAPEAKEAALDLYNDKAHVAYITTDNKLAYIYQTDEGWSEPVIIGSANANGDSVTTDALSCPDIATDSNGKVHIAYVDTDGAEDDYYHKPDGMYATNAQGGFIISVIANCTGWRDAGSDYDDLVTPIKIDYDGTDRLITYKIHNTSTDGWSSSKYNNYTIYFNTSTVTTTYDMDTNSSGKIYEVCREGTHYYTFMTRQGNLVVFDGNTAVEGTEFAASVTSADMTLYNSDIYYAGINGNELVFDQDGTFSNGVLAATSISGHTNFETVVSNGTQYVVYSGSNEGDVSLVISKFSDNQMYEYVVPSETKSINFQGNHLVVNDDGSVTYDCEVTNNTGSITFVVYNSDGVLLRAEPSLIWDEELEQNVPDGREAWVDVGQTDYDGIYSVVSSDTVRLNDIKFDLAGGMKYLNEDSILDLSINAEHLRIASWDIKPLYENKEIYLQTDNLTVNDDGSVSVDSFVQYNTGMVKVFIRNADGTLARIENTTSYDEESGTYVVNEHEARAYLNQTTFEGAYLELSSNTVNVEELICHIGENRISVEEGGIVHLPDTEYVSIAGEYFFDDAIERPRIQFHSENLALTEDGGVLLECNLEGNSGTLKVIPYNSDGSKVPVRYYDKQDEETGEWGIDPENAFGDVNGKHSSDYDGAYLVVTSDDVNLDDFKFNFSGQDCFLDEDGVVDLTGCPFVILEDWSYKDLYEKKIVQFRSDSLVLNEDGSVTMNTEIEGNDGPVTIELYNSDGSKVILYNCMGWNDETNEPEIDPRRAEGKLNTPTYEGAYLIITAEDDVDLTDIKIGFDAEGTEIGEDGIVYLPANAEYVNVEPWIFYEKTMKQSVHFYFEEGMIVNEDGTVTIPCNVKDNMGAVTLELHNSDDSKVMIHKCVFYDWQTDSDYESDKDAEGRLNTPSYEGAYFVVTSDDVELENIMFRIDGEDLYVDEDGIVTLGNYQYVYIDKYTIKNANPEMVEVTVNATSTDGKISVLRINDVEFADDVSTNSINKIIEVEELDEDRFIICVEEGKIIKYIKINDVEHEFTEDEYSNSLDFDFPHADTYDIEIICDDDPYYLPYVVWTYNDEEMYGGDALIENGEIEVVSVTLPDGTVLDYEDLLPVDDPGIGMHPQHYEAYLMEQGGRFVNLYAQTGSTVVIKIIPDEGYMVSYNPILINGYELVKDPNVENQYSLVMPNDVVFLSGVIVPYEEPDNGLIYIDGTIYYFVDGEVATDYTGLVRDEDGIWFYVQNGAVNEAAKTLVEYKGNWFYVNNGTIDWKYTGLVQYANNWFYVQGGILKWGVRTLVEYNGTWFYVNNSYIDWSYTGLVEYCNNWFYVQGGILKWGVRTLVEYNGTWFYVNNSYIDWSYTGLVEYCNNWFYIQGGILKWGVRTLVEYNGNWFYVNNSYIDWSYTGLVTYNGHQFYIQGGILKWGYNGTVTINGVKYTIKNSIVV